MADVLVLGAGVSGHTAALHLSRLLPKGHTVTVVSPNSHWNWIPSNVWVGVGKMGQKDVVFPLAPVYAKKGIRFVQARATTLWPRGDGNDLQPGVDVEHTSGERGEEVERIRYDYLVNATGPQLKFQMTQGLGPDAGHSVSVCTADHAVHAASELARVIETLKTGTPQTLVIGMGHGTCTCEGPRSSTSSTSTTSCARPGCASRPTGLPWPARKGSVTSGSGMTFDDGGFETTSELWTSSLFRERGVEPILGAHVHRVDPGVVHFEMLDGSMHSLEFDFAMLAPPFGGEWDWRPSRPTAARSPLSCSPRAGS